MSTLVELLEHLDAFRRPARFEQFVLACEADARGRRGLEEREYPQAAYLRRALSIAADVKLDAATLAELPGPKIRDRIRESRIAALKSALTPTDKT
jgi:tRNA nucleotidyltransferase (CCA-adding enzyme)